MGERRIQTLKKARSLSGPTPAVVGLWTNGDTGFSVVLQNGDRHIIPDRIVFDRVADYVRRERVEALGYFDSVGLLGVGGPE